MDELTVWTPVTLYFGEERIDVPLAVAVWRVQGSGDIPWSIRTDGQIMPLAICDGDRVHGLPDLIAAVTDPGHMRSPTPVPRHPADPVLIAFEPVGTEPVPTTWAVLPLARALLVAAGSLARGERGMIRPTTSLEVSQDYGDEAAGDLDWLIGWSGDECTGLHEINDLVAVTAQGLIRLDERQRLG